VVLEHAYGVFSLLLVLARVDAHLVRVRVGLGSGSGLVFLFLARVEAHLGGGLASSER
jgi:hypothetical protein